MLNTKILFTRSNLYRHLFHLSIVLLIVCPWPLLLRQDIDGSVSMAMLLKSWSYMMLLTIPFYYANVYWFVPKVLKRRKYISYLLIIIVCIACCVFLRNFLEPTNFRHFVSDKQEAIGKKSIHVFPMLLLFALGTSLEMIISWESQRTKQEIIEKERLASELSFLKTQINPHFLFNSLNNIYSLSGKKSDKTGEAILLLSNIMRYVLYDANHSKISLAKEIQHMEDYIAMQKLRIVDSEAIRIEFSYKGSFAGLMIEPLILIPFVENAFKHGISYNQPSSVIIDLQVSQNQFMFGVTNSKRKQSDGGNDKSMEPGGIGIVNTKRRLDLIYGDRYTLNIEDSNDTYTVYLSINLKEKQDYYQENSHSA